MNTAAEEDATARRSERHTSTSTPEQIRIARIAGALAYYLLTGQPPFVRPTPVQTMAAHLADPVSPPANYNKDVPPGLEAIVMRALNKNREDRFQSVSEMVQALDAFLNPAQGGIA